MFLKQSAFHHVGETRLQNWATQGWKITLTGSKRKRDWLILGWTVPLQKGAGKFTGVRRRLACVLSCDIWSTCLLILPELMRGSFSRRQRGPLRLYTTEVNGKCFVKHILSHSSVGSGRSGDDHFIRGIFHSVGYVSSHATHQLQSLGGSDDYVCSSAVGQKHETTLSGSLITTVKFRHHRWSELAFSSKMSAMFIVIGDVLFWNGCSQFYLI